MTRRLAAILAARIEEISSHGGVAISDAVWGALDGALKPSFDDQGQMALENIAHPVKVSARGGDVAGGGDTKGKAGFPHLAIVLVETSSDDAEMQELAAAITSDLMTYLSAVQWIDAKSSADPAPGAYIARGADALEHSRKALAIIPDYPAANRHLAAIFALKGDVKAAADQPQILERLIPDGTISAVWTRLRMADTEGARRYWEGLRLAGIASLH